MFLNIIINVDNLTTPLSYPSQCYFSFLEINWSACFCKKRSSEESRRADANSLSSFARIISAALSTASFVSAAALSASASSSAAVFGAVRLGSGSSLASSFLDSIGCYSWASSFAGCEGSASFAFCSSYRSRDEFFASSIVLLATVS